MEKKKKSKGYFFAIGKPQWEAACKLGFNQAAAFIVMASGSMKDNVTTEWAATSIEKYLGMGWRRARDAVQSLISAKLVTSVGNKGPRQKPLYRLDLPKSRKEFIWLPNELVTGAGNEVPPMARLRQCRDLDLLAMFISLYFEHDLRGDGGLPRSLIHDEYEREQIATHGQYVFYGFRHKTGTAYYRNAFAPYQHKPEGSLWEHIKVLCQLGLLTKIQYIAESEDPESELLHALSGDEHADAAYIAAINSVETKEGYIVHRSEAYDFTIPVLAHFKRATVVGVYRLTYRPKTKMTAMWYAQHVERCQKAAQAYDLIFGDKQEVA